MSNSVNTVSELSLAGHRSQNQNGVLGLAELLLKDRAELFGLIQRQESMSRVIPGLLILTLMGTGLTGVILGSYAGGWQMLYAGIKVPLLLVMTLAVCHSGFWAMALYFRVPLRGVQVAALTLSAMATTSLWLLGLCPLLWLMLGGGARAYHLAILSMVFVFGMSGIGGVRVLVEGLRRLTQDTQGHPSSGWRSMIMLWILLYGLVGMQMAWLLRPYLFHPWANERPLTFLREFDGNVYQAIWKTILAVLGGS